MHSLRSVNEVGHWLRGCVSGDLSADSRQLHAGDGFIAWPGAAHDARQYVEAALAQGASACLIEREGAQAFNFSDAAVRSFPQLKAATGAIAASFYGQPSHDLDVIAVTGTNGKTSTTWWLAQALAQLAPTGGGSCGVIGTLGLGIAPTTRGAADPLAGFEVSGLTTPDPVLLQRQLRRWVRQGVSACAIEASSIGLAEHRLDGTRIRVAVFTNFTQDHLDYHGSMAAYWRAKSALFDWPQLASAVVNIDDPHGATLAERLRGLALDLWTVALDTPARLRALDVGYSDLGMHCQVQESTPAGARREHLQTALLGRYNIANVLGVIASLRALGVGLPEAVRACSQLGPVPGRMECLGGAGTPMVVVDYAHTPDALEQALRALRPMAQQRLGQLWCVFGCGGDRDASKRPLMAAVAQAHADQVVLTSDNPRSENPHSIIQQMQHGLTHAEQVQVQADRALAIAQTVQAADARDLILIAGKGHETTQETGGVRQPFSDQAHVRRALAARMPL